jgi:hypothetical protein
MLALTGNKSFRSGNRLQSRGLGIAGSAMLLSVTLSACAPVQPWERGNLAKPHMAMQPFPIQAAFREHIYGSRESASGGSASSGGGGCGCY